MDMVKGAIFSGLGEYVEGARVLDLFAGSGGLGIEALSRGAGHVNFVEADPKAARVIGLNLGKTRLADRPHEVHTMDVFRFLDRFAEQGSFELVLADPPYAKARGDRNFTPELLASEGLLRGLVPGGLFVLEHRPGDKLSLGTRWECLRQKRYGATEVALLRRCGGEG